MTVDWFGFLSKTCWIWMIFWLVLMASILKWSWSCCWHFQVHRFAPFWLHWASRVFSGASLLKNQRSTPAFVWQVHGRFSGKGSGSCELAVSLRQQHWGGAGSQMYSTATRQTAKRVTTAGFYNNAKVIKNSFFKDRVHVSYTAMP